MLEACRPFGGNGHVKICINGAFPSWCMGEHLCRRGGTADAMGWLKLGPNVRLRIRVRVRLREREEEL